MAKVWIGPHEYTGQGLLFHFTVEESWGPGVGAPRLGCGLPGPTKWPLQSNRMLPKGSPFTTEAREWATVI